MKIKVCDICDAPIKDEYKDNTILKLSVPIRCKGENGYWYSRRKMDICPNCMRKLMRGITKELNNKK